MLTKPIHNEPHGCTDQAPPTEYSAYQLSRIYDILFNAQEARIEPQKLFSVLPDAMKLEFNYSNWRYKEYQQIGK